MTEYDDFNSGELYLLFDNDILASLDLPFMVSASVEETENMLYIEGYPSPGCLSSRFKSMSEEQLQLFKDSRQSNSLKKEYHTVN